MNGLYLGLFSVVCLTLLARRKTTASEDDSEHDIVCEGSVMKLKCLNKSFAITVQSAIYGRNLPGNVLCPKLDHMSSSLSDELTCRKDVYSKVSQLCEGKMTCDIPANKLTFDEPCPNVYKYLDVAYKCEDVLNRDIRQLVVVNLSQTPTAIFPTATTFARMSVSTVQLQRTPTLVHKIAQLNTVYKQLNSSGSTLSPTSQPGTTSSSYSVSVSRVSQGESTTRTDTITKLHSTPPISLPPSKPAPKTTENITTHETHAKEKKHGTMKLFHFILSFQIVRQEKLEKHTASSLVCFFLGLLLGLLIMMAVFVFYRLRRSRRKRQGKPDKAAYSKHETLSGDVDEKVELNSKESEALEMESQFGETV